MNPSSELDLFIAKEIMGLKAQKVKGALDVPLYVVDDGDSDDWEIGVVRSNVPHYSTNIEDAWKVVDKLRNKNRVFCLTTLVDHSLPNLQWIAKWEMHEPNYRYEFGVHENAPMAIILASLKALGINFN